MYFNPHHPQGGDISKALESIGFNDFNPHHPQGGDMPCFGTKSAGKDFNPHHPQGGDKYLANLKCFRPHFNPHHPQGGDSNFAQKPLLIPIHLHQQSAPNSLYILHSSTSKSNPKKYLIKIPVRIPRGFHVRFRFALKDQRLFHINPLIHSNMFNPCLILIPQIIKSEAIHIFINQFR